VPGSHGGGPGTRTSGRRSYPVGVREQPEQQAPPVQRVRIRYAKRGRLRFTSHRDFSRAFERALVRARVPMAYSSGFNPHPRISYAGAAPTGSASEAEYLEIGLAERVDLDELRATLDEALPIGLDVVAVAESPGGALADLLSASRWRLDTTAEPDALAGAVAAFLASETVLVERMTKKGMREFDARAAVASLEVEGTSLDLFLHHTVPAVRPDDVLTALRNLAGLDTGPAPLLTRLEQGVPGEEPGSLRAPFG
jgi:radical SAM-linked protein